MPFENYCVGSSTVHSQRNTALSEKEKGMSGTDIPDTLIK